MRGLLFAALLGFCSVTAAETLLWTVRGPQAQHHLLGSVHVLPASAYPLPAAIEDAYRKSRGLVFEADLTVLNSADSRSQMRSAARDTAQPALPERLPAALRARLEQRAQKVGMVSSPCRGYRTWFCAALLESVAAQRAGFSAEFGLDAHLHGRALKDGKSLTALETPQAQLEALSGMSEALAQQMLAANLDEEIGEGDDPRELLRIWKSGDLAALERIEDTLRRKYPAVHARLLADRNRAWLPALRRQLDGREPQLIVVGALHLAGDAGLPALLAAAGYKLSR